MNFISISMDVHITYETLFDLLRKERSLQELQNLNEDFWKHVVEYLQERNEFMKKTSLSEQEKSKIQLQNIKRIIREIYEHRQRKIVNLAINVVHSEIISSIDTRSMLPEEKNLFKKLTIDLDKHRKNVLIRVMNHELPNNYSFDDSFEEKNNQEKNEKTSVKELEKETDEKENDRKENNKEETNEYNKENNNEDMETKYSKNKDNKSEKDKENKEDNKENNKEKTSEDEEIIVKFISSVPKFLGKDKQVFGPFEEGTITSLPQILVNILLKKEKVVKVIND